MRIGLNSLLIFLTFLLFFPSSLFAEKKDTVKRAEIVCPPERFIPKDSLAFEAGEKLKYIMHYKWLGIKTDVGEGTVYLSNADSRKGREVLQTRIVGSTYKFWDSFFKVRELFESRFYADNLRPLYFYRDTHEGKYKIKNTYHWDEGTNEIYARVERVKEEPLDTLLQGETCTFDLPTMFYYARNINFDKIEKGVNQPLSFAIDEEIFNIYFRFIGREVKNIYSIGEWRTLKFAAKVVAGEVFNGKHEMYIWVTDDANKIPLLFEVPIIVGTMSGRLVEYENVKFPMNCKIEEEL